MLCAHLIPTYARASKRKGSDDDDDDEDSPKPRGKPKKGDKVTPKDKGPKGKRRPFDDSGSDEGSDGSCVFASAPMCVKGWAYCGGGGRGDG